MRLLWPLAASLALSVPASATTTHRQDSLTVTVATRTGTRLGAVRMPRAASLVLTTWRALPVYGTSPSASIIGLTSAEWSAADIGDATTVEVRLAIDTLAAGNRILVRTGTLVRSIRLAMPAPSAVPVASVAAPPRTAPQDTPTRSDSLPQWVRAARESFNAPARTRPPVSPSMPAVAPPGARSTPAPKLPEAANELVERPSRGLTAGRPTEPDATPAPLGAERYDLAELVRPVGAVSRRTSATSTDVHEDGSTPHRLPGPTPARQAVAAEVVDLPRPQAFLRLSYLDAPQFLVLAVERPVTRAISASLESARALSTQQLASAPSSIASFGARWYLMSQRRTPYLFGDVGVAWADSTRVGRHGAGLGVLWQLAGLMDLDVAVRAWGQRGQSTEPARWTAGVRVHFPHENEE